MALPASLTGWDEEADEAAVLDAARGGDRAAQTELFHRHRDRVARQVLRMCGDPAAVEGMDLAAASAALGVPISAVSYRTRRAEQWLCAALGVPWGAP